MVVLAIDTAFAACMVGLVDPRTGVAHSSVKVMERGQAEALVPMIQDVLRDAHLGFDDLDLVVVNVGPGSFTGVRVGIATARGIALARHIPVQGVISTDALYTACGDGGSARIIIDTRRGDYFVADYKDAHDVPQNIADIQIIAEGAGDIVRTVIRDDMAATLKNYPIMLAELGARLYADKTYVLNNSAEPVYLRDAEVSTAKK